MEKGADYLDVNVATGQGWHQEVKDMKWIVEEVQHAVDKPLSIDTADYRVMEAGLQVHRGMPFINSVTAEPDRQEAVLELAAKYGGKLVILPVRENIPPNADERFDLCGEIQKHAYKFGIDRDNIYFDALVLPLSVNNKNPQITLETMRLIKGAGWQTALGLSNISYGLPQRRILNRTFLVSAMTLGLDAVFLNPLEQGIMGTISAGKALLGEDEMCMNYLKAYRQGKLSDK